MFKIAVYAIAKNEAQHVYRWYQSVKQADYVYVLDTGSVDSTVDKLMRCGKVRVSTMEESDFRFDHARQKILNKVNMETDCDFAIFVDLDDVLEEGWYPKLQQAIAESPRGVNAFEFTHNYELVDDKPVVSYQRLCCHVPNGFTWHYPVHEVLAPNEGVVLNKRTVDIQINHYPDLNKERNYIDLLEIGVAEYNDARSHRYLARELQRLNRADEALPHYLYAAELEQDNYLTSEIYTALGECYEYLNQFEDAQQAFVYAAWSMPSAREGWASLASFCWRNQLYQQAISATLQMFYIKDKPLQSLIVREEYYLEWPYHMLAVCYNALGMEQLAQANIDKAFELAPSNQVVIRDMLSIRNIPITNSPATQTAE